MADKKVTVAADGLTATTTDATIGDMFTTLFSTDTFVTGTYGLMQKATLFVGGMALQTNRLTGKWNPF